MNKKPNTLSTVDPRPAGFTAPTGYAIRCSATNPDQWITLYENGAVRIHTRNLDTTTGTESTATYKYRPKLKTEREAIRQLIEHLNLTAAGIEGHPYRVEKTASQA